MGGEVKDRRDGRARVLRSKDTEKLEVRYLDTFYTLKLTLDVMRALIYEVIDDSDAVERGEDERRPTRRYS